jgi:mono/diheme cytochrome c family protein
MQRTYFGPLTWLAASGALILTAFTSIPTPLSSDAATTHSLADSGKVVYETYCLPCHQANAKGVSGLNPPLTQTEWVLGDKARLIGIVLNGFSEGVEIKGEYYANAMPAHSHLNDQQIADVLTYVRSNFGNKASAITPTEVAEVRTKKKK